MDSSDKRKRRRVTRREAATILGTSYENVKRLQRRRLLHGIPDDRGHYWLDRREVDDLAKARGEQKKQGLDFDARVFALFKEGKACRDVVMVTRQPFETIHRLWEKYRAGSDPGPSRVVKQEAQVLREHEENLRAMEADLARRRRRAMDDEPPESDPNGTKKGPKQ